MKKITVNSLTNQIRQVGIVVLSVFLLGGDHKAIDTEDIGIKCHQLAPGMFSWRKYRDQINLELVRVALSDAKKKQNGQLLQGSGRDGWRLTAKGLEWSRERGQEILEEDVRWSSAVSQRQAGSVDSRRRDREEARVRRSEAWGEWLERKSMSVASARGLFRIDAYSSRTMAETKIVRLSALFDIDSDLSVFLKHAGQLVMDTLEDNDG
jgi:hypothetical protein